MGYHLAGFEVVGVDINEQPRYPFEHHQADALEYLAEHGHEFDAIHASPPCQLYSSSRTLAGHHGAEYPDLLEPTRDALMELGKPWVIENVPGAPMSDYIQLCGSQFGMVAPDVDGVTVQLRRHRWFESSAWLVSPGPCNHLPDMPTASVMGYGGAFSPEWRDRRRASPGPGGKGYVPALSVCRELMGVDWTNKRELSESIPPTYTVWIGSQLMAAL